jgi:uncharacterized membrane protein
MKITKSDNALERVMEKTPIGDGMQSLPSKEFVVPAVLGLAGAVAAKKAPDMVRSLTGSLENKGEEEAQDFGRKMAEGAKQGMFKGGGGDGAAKKTRRLPIQRWTDVAVPIDQAYDAWNKFDQYPKFMHRVLSVEQKGQDRVNWQEKIWFSKRQWEGEITERRKNDRIVWKTKNGMNHKGIVSFHRLDDRLTRVMVEMEFEPTGMIEKMASGLRFVKRAVQSDLARFKAYVEMEDAKGIEYRPVRDDEEDEQQQQQRGESRSGRSDDGRSDEERDSERQERESRREERRRETAGSR